MASDDPAIEKLSSLLYPRWGFPAPVPKLQEYVQLIGEYSNRLGLAWIVYFAARDHLFNSLPTKNPHALPKHEKKYLLGTWWQIENQLIENFVLSVAASVENLVDGIDDLLRQRVSPIEQLNTVLYNKEVHQLRELANVIKHDGGYLHSKGGRAAKNLIARYNFPDVGLPANSYSLFDLTKKDIDSELFQVWVFGISLLDAITNNRNPWLDLPENELKEIMRQRLLPGVFVELEEAI